MIPSAPRPADDAITIRRLGPADDERLERLRQLDSHSGELAAPALGAEIGGRLVAAVSLADGESIADPFMRTVELRSLLELRAAQVRRRERRRLRWRRRPAGARPRGALAASPPGAGGRLLTLSPRA